MLTDATVLLERLPDKRYFLLVCAFFLFAFYFSVVVKNCESRCFLSLLGMKAKEVFAYLAVEAAAAARAIDAYSCSLALLYILFSLSLIFNYSNEHLITSVLWCAIWRQGGRSISISHVETGKMHPQGAASTTKMNFILAAPGGC